MHAKDYGFDHAQKETKVLRRIYIVLPNFPKFGVYN